MKLNDIAEKYAVEAVNKSDIEASWFGFLQTIIKRACIETATEAAEIAKCAAEEPSDSPGCIIASKAIMAEIK
jgi:hypothetical protein